MNEGRFEVLETDFDVVAILPPQQDEMRKSLVEELKKVRGVKHEETSGRIRIRTDVRRQGKDVYAVAYPIDGTSAAKFLGSRLDWEFTTEVAYNLKAGGNRRSMVAVSGKGEYLKARCIPIQKKGVGESYLLVGIKNSVAHVVAILNGSEASWEISRYCFDESQGARVFLHKETYSLAFPAEMKAKAMLAKPGVKFPNKAEVMNKIGQAILESNESEDEQECLLMFLEPMAVSYLRMCGQTATLTKPEPAVATDPDEYEDPELTLVPSTPEPTPELDPQAIADKQAAAMSEEKKVRGKKATKKPKAEKPKSKKAKDPDQASRKRAAS